MERLKKILGKGRRSKIAPEPYDNGPEHQVYKYLLKHYIPEKGREARHVLQDRDAHRDLVKLQSNMIAAKGSRQLVDDLARSFREHDHARDRDFEPHPIG